MSERVTFSGRMAHVLGKLFPGLGKAGSRRQAANYERSGGRKSASIMGKPTFRLTVVGRKSGEPRSVMLMLVRRGDDLLVAGSEAGAPDHPNWWKNLMAAGEAQVQVGPDSWAVRAYEVTDPAEREAAWSALCAVYPDFASYQLLTERRIPVGALVRKNPA